MYSRRVLLFLAALSLLLIGPAVSASDDGPRQSWLEVAVDFVNGVLAELGDGDGDQADDEGGGWAVPVG